MTARTVLGPHGYSRPPYGSFANKPLFVPVRTYTQTFTVLGPYGYSRPPYGSFAGKNAATIIPRVGMLGGKPAKRWWEELLEEYKEKYPERLTTKAARKVEKVLEPAIEAAEVIGETPEVEALVRAVQLPGNTVQIIAAANAVVRAAKLVAAEDDEEETIIMLLLS